MNEVLTEKIEIEIPTTLLPVIETIGKLTGRKLKEFINNLLRHDFRTLFDTPTDIFLYHTTTDSEFFKAFKTGLEQWDELEQNQEKDHKRKD